MIQIFQQKCNNHESGICLMDVFYENLGIIVIRTKVDSNSMEPLPDQGLAPFPASKYF